MNKLKYLIAIAAVMGALTMSAKADLQFLGAVPFGANNNPDTNLAALAAFGINTTGFDPNNPVTNIEGLNGGNQTISVTARASTSSFTTAKARVGVTRAAVGNFSRSLTAKRR